MFRRFLPVLFLALTPAVAHTQEVPSGRYQLKEMGDGVVRLDTETGALAFCAIRDGKPECSGLESTDAPSAADIAALQTRIASLEKQVAALKPSSGNLPSDEEVDRSLSIMEKFMRRFMGLAKEFGDEENGSRGKESDPLPQKT